MIFKKIRIIVLVILLLCISASPRTIAQTASNTNAIFEHVAELPMDMMILSGTGEYLKNSIQEAKDSGAKILVIKLDTPGGVLQVTQEMVQAILNAPLPIAVYVSPQGGTATSAGVFITLAGHIAVMAPGTSIGAAHPVQGDGKNIEGDMRAKAENITIAMVKAISEARGRNIEWAEKSVKDSASLTEKEALKLNVIDFVADDLMQLLKQIKGRKVKVGADEITLEDYSNLTVKVYEMSFRDRAINVLADPNVVALLWLGATTGITLELYNPGAILPGVVGAICLVLALLVSSVIPISQGGLLLFILGALLLSLEVYVGSGILGIGGIVALSLGAVYLIDIHQAPGLTVALEMLLPIIFIVAGFLVYTAREVRRAYLNKPTTGADGLIGKTGIAVENIVSIGRVHIDGEYWQAHKAEQQAGIINKGNRIEVLSVEPGLVLKVRKVDNANQ